MFGRRRCLSGELPIEDNKSAITPQVIQLLSVVGHEGRSFRWVTAVKVITPQVIQCLTVVGKRVGLVHRTINSRYGLRGSSLEVP